MSNLPDLPDNNRARNNTIIVARAARTARRAELEMFEHRVHAAVRRDKDIADSESLADALSVATDEELSFLREFRAKANGSEAATELVARKLEIFSTINNRRISRRFS
jgi:hypothetical protein